MGLVLVGSLRIRLAHAHRILVLHSIIDAERRPLALGR